LNVLDAIAPCIALLWASLNLGMVADGTREGMLTSVPWAVPSPFGRVHPVEIYSAVGGLLLCGALLWILRRARTPGETCAWGLVLSGLLIFFMQFFRLPGVLYSNSLLEGAEVRGLEFMVGGGLLLAWREAASQPTMPGRKDLNDAV
jgi:prolipoprotein diacylglyceryltransferase